MWLTVCMSLMLIKRWYRTVTFPAGPPFLTVFYCPVLSLPPQASPCAEPQDLTLFNCCWILCDLLPQVWKETLSAGVGRLGRPSPGWSERGHRVSKAKTGERPALCNRVYKDSYSRLTTSLSTSGVPRPSTSSCRLGSGMGSDWFFLPFLCTVASLVRQGDGNVSLYVTRDPRETLGFLSLCLKMDSDPWCCVQTSLGWEGNSRCKLESCPGVFASKA